ncbi:hypothetical protein PHET_02272 [Paragonimus heterotremus]|uniref:Uncharacterized protein n=1 Tax=Paragonimus heterotremus TaxID=100268 RepID=A0A8J4WK20_9TREM|nr:hypothetical protein PHET_02272 [Paragonimus heterotremus]
MVKWSMSRLWSGEASELNSLSTRMVNSYDCKLGCLKTGPCLAIIHKDHKCYMYGHILVSTGPAEFEGPFYSELECCGKLKLDYPDRLMHDQL